ncbi:MAG TPA: tyrosine-type recombinase/integrase, partial [Rhodothermales bacterium]|nr:tyrosine-type recombinase/integrase [Rhodothermales bacterium]
MATLVKQKGHFYLQFYDRARTPERKRVALKTSQKRTADALRRKLEHDHALGRFDPWRDDPFTYDRAPSDARAPVTLRGAIVAFIEDRRAHGREPTTLRTYTTILTTFADEVEKRRPGSDGDERGVLGSITASDVQAFVWSESVAPATRYTRYRHVKAFLARAVKLGLCEGPGPASEIEPPPNVWRLPRLTREEDLEAVCTALENEYRDKRARGKCRNGTIVWMVPLLRFAYFSGLRASELARLRWYHVDLRRRTLTLLKQKNKQEEVLPLGERALGVLSEMKKGAPADYV